MKTVAWIVGTLTLIVAGGYTVVSLARWQWNRALFFAIVFVAAEVLLAAGAVASRMAKVERELAVVRRSEPTSLHALRATRHDQKRFPWLTVDPYEAMTRTNVFITLAVGGGILLSGGAWLIDKIAGRTVDPQREARLSRELESIAYEPGLVVDDVNVLARTRIERTEPGLDAFLEPNG